MTGPLFVGRAAELGRLATLLAPAGTRVHAIHAPGGIGKTTLARAFQRKAAGAGFATAWADAAVLDVTPTALVDAWRAELGLDDLKSLPADTVLFLDDFQCVRGLERWLRTRLMADAGPRARLVLIGRHPPSPLWTTAPEWIGRIGVSRLACWDPPEAERYLAARNVAESERATAIAASYGHPLALALLADVHGQSGDDACALELSEHPSLVAHLAEKMCGSLHDGQRRQALAVAAEARVTTQSLLEAMIELDDGYALFSWLRGLSFMQTHPQGLVPHDLVRDVVRYELAWRDPAGAAVITQRFRDHILATFDQATDRRRELDLLRDLAFLHRNHPMARNMFAFQPVQVLCPQPAAPQDLPLVEAMLQSHGLGESMPAVRYWYDRQPESLVVMRDVRGTVVGTELAVRVTDAVLAEAEPHDAAAAPLRAALAKREAPRADEHALVGRVWCTHAGQTVNEVQSQLWLNRVRDCVRASGLAHVVAYFREPQAWMMPFSYMGFQRAPDADFDDGGEAQGAFIRDWRLQSTAEWFLRMAQLAAGQEAPVARPGPQRTAVVLSETAFADAVKQALRVYPARSELAKNPLANSRLVAVRAGPTATGEERAEVLAQLLEEALDAVRLTPATRKAYRALYRTFVNPADTQREAAKFEAMPFGTFRRQLATGLTRVTATMWELEVAEET